MELMIRVSAASLCAMLIGLLLRRTNPELTVLLSAASIAVILLASLGALSGLGQLSQLLCESFGLNEYYIRPVWKSVAAAIVTKLTAELCRDASQNAAAAAVELAGSFCALGILMPLLIAMMKTVGGYL